MIELNIENWGDTFTVAGTEDEDAGTYTVVEADLPTPPQPMGRTVGDVVVNGHAISAIDRSPLGDPPVWCWVFHKA